jgi:hypothetical protein
MRPRRWKKGDQPDARGEYYCCPMLRDWTMYSQAAWTGVGAVPCKLVDLSTFPSQRSTESAVGHGVVADSVLVGESTAILRHNRAEMCDSHASRPRVCR